MEGIDNNTNNQLLRSLVESFSEPVALVDDKFNYVIFNQVLVGAMMSLYGCKVEIGHAISEYLSPLEWDVVKTYLDRSLKGETVIVNSFLGTHNSRYYEITHKPYIDDNSKEILGVFIFVKDITELHQFEQEKIINEKRLECLVRISTSGIKDIQEFVVFSLNEALVLTNSKFGYIYFYDEQKKEFTLNSWSDAVMEACMVVNPQTVYQLEKTGFWGEAVRQRKCILVNDFQAPHPKKKGLPEGHATLNNFMTIPVFFDEKIVAVVGVANKETDYTDSDIKHLDLLMNSVWKIVARMQAEEALKISESLHTNVLNNAIDGFFTIANDYSFLMVNDAFCKMVGYSKEELLCLSVADFEQDKENVDVHKENLLKNGIDCFETKFKCKNESIIDVEIRLSFLKENQLAFGFIRDISQKKLDELNLLNSRKSFKIMYENAPLSYQSLSSTTQFLDVNKTWLKTLGYERDEVIGHYFGEFLTPESAELVKTRFPNFMHNGEMHDNIFDMVRKDGTIISVSYDGNIGYDEFGSFKQTHCIFQDVTERLKSEKRIKDSEKKFRNIFESTVIGISITSIDGDMNVNDAFCRIVGYSEDELNGLNWKQITHKDDILENEKRIQLLKEGHDKSQRWIKRYIHKNGNIVWVDINTALQRDEFDKPEYFITAISDITDRKENELKLIESEERYRSLFNSNYSVMLIIDPDTSAILDANPAACEFYGWSYEEICQKKILDINTLPRAQVFEHMQEAKRNKRKQFQFTHRKSDGSLSDVEVYGTALKLENKTVVHVIIHDITESKLAQNSLAESERRFRDLLSNVQLISIILDLDGSIVFCNDYLLDLTQWKREEIIGKNWFDVFINTEIVDVVKKLFKKSVVDNEIEIHYENPIIAKDGTEFIISWNNTSLYNESGKIDGIACLGINVTEQKAAFSSLQSAKDRLNRAELATKSGNWELHLDTGLIKTSQGAKLVYGLTVSDNEYSEIVNSPLVEYRGILDKAMADLINHNIPYDIEFKILAGKSGLIKDIHSTAVYDKDAKIVFGVITDITERKEIEDKLADNRAKLEAALFSMTDAVLITDVEGNAVEINNAFAYFHRFSSREEFLELHTINPDFLELYTLNGELISKNDWAVTRALNGEISTNNEFIIKRKDTAETWYGSSSFSPICDSKGRIVGSVVVVRDITHLKIAERAIAESEHKYRMLADNVKDVIWTMNGEGRFTYMSPSVIDLRGYTADEVLGQTIGEVLTEESLDLVMPLFNSAIEAIRAGNLYPTIHLELEQKCKDGSTVWTDVTANTFVDHTEDSISILGISRNISDKKKAEKALIESEDQLKQVLRGSKLGFWDWDMVKNQVARNERWAEMLGYTLEDIELTIGGWSALIHPEDTETALKSIENHVAGLTAQHSEIYRMQCKDGEWKWIHDRAQIVSYDINGKPLRMCGTHEDISEAKKNELALLENEKKLSALFSSMAEMVVIHELVFDEHGKPINYRVLDCNNAYVQITAISRHRAVGNLATDIYNTTEPPYFDEYVDVCVSGKNLDFKVYYKPLDKHFMVSAVCLGNNRFATITSDITEIEKSKEEIFEKNKELENYIYVASHDLRSPLVNIQGFSQRLIKQSAELNDILSVCELDNSIQAGIDKLAKVSIPKSLNFILTNVTKMDKLITGLLQVSRTGRLALIVKEVDAKELIQTILMTSSFQLNDVGAKVYVGELENCFGDEGQLNQLFSNLISNSLKYRDEHRNLVIEISSETKLQKVLYKIKDNGIGISARHAEKVWDVFFRANSNPVIEGDGLGLSLSKKIVDKHKGKIWLESEEGVGTTFFVELNSVKFAEN